MKIPSRKLTTWEADKKFSVPDSTIVAAIKAGHIPFETVSRGDSVIHTFTEVDFQEYLLSTKAGKHQRPTIDLPIGDISHDQRFQLREKLNDRVVREYGGKMLSGTRFKPVILVKLDGLLLMVDGFHRLGGASSVGLSTVSAQIIDPCDPCDAKILALRANRDHGLPRTNADKKNVAMSMLVDPRFSTMKGRDIAILAGVSPMSITRYRNELGGNKSPVKESKEADATSIEWAVEKIEHAIAVLKTSYPAEAASIEATLKLITS